MSFRIDSDSMGEVKLPKDAYFGAQTQRSLDNFAIGSEVMPLSFIRAYALVKLAAARANHKLGLLDKERAELIFAACQEIINGELAREFPLKIWQTGSGTQTNMNLNEVISARANQISGKNLGAKSPVHPNDHVNLSQSTNDSFPTAMHVCIALEVVNNLLPKLEKLINILKNKADNFKNITKMGRTHLQDATPITLGQEISGYVAQLDLCVKNIKNNNNNIYELALGGTAVGTGLNTHKNFANIAAQEIANLTKLPFVSAPNKFAALAAHDACVELSGSLNTLACALMKIANDIRWLASGPRGGLGEILISANEPGSSIMPGKINPTQCEAITMVCCQVMGNHVAVTIAGSQGNFELNVYKPVILRNITHSLEILTDSIYSFSHKCAQTIEPNLARIEELKNRSLMLVTALTPRIGYDKAAQIAKQAHEQNKTLKQVVVESKILSATEFEELVVAEKMLGPNIS